MAGAGVEARIVEALAGIDADELLASWQECCAADGVLRAGHPVELCPKAATALLSVLAEPYGYQEEIAELAEVAQEILDCAGTGGLSSRQLLGLAEAIAASLRLDDGPARVEFERRLRLAISRLILYVNVAALRAADHLAHRDVLTGLRNRLAFKTDTEKSADRGLALRVVFIDIDGLKQVNDALGHEAGDDLLRRVASALMGCCAGGEYAYRFGGDEYAFLSTVRTTNEVEMLMAEMSSEATPFSWGVASFPDDGASMEDVTNAADKRMYERKRDRKRVQANAPFPGNVMRRLWACAFRAN